jgi:hypothetical protein
MQSAFPIFPYGTDFLSLEFPTFRKFGLSLHDHFIPHPRNNYHPHALSHRMLALLSLLLMTVKIAGISLVVLMPAAPTQASAITTSTVISLANAARAEGGLTALTANSLLTNAAQAKANDMLAKQYFAHNTPSGDTPWTFIKAAGYSYVTAGENLAIDFTEAESVQSAWMNSPGHRANIMNKSFQEIGIGISKGMYNGHQTTIVVQMFGTPISQAVEMPAAPTPVAQAAPAPAPTPTPAPAPTEVAAPAPQTQQAPQPVPQTKVIVQGDKLVEVPVGTQMIEIKSTETELQGNNLYLNVTASGDATKLLATYGSQSIMLDPSENNQWHGYIPLASLNAHTNLIVYAYDINGNLTQAPISQFSPSLNASLQGGEVEGASITLFGKIINPGVWEEKIILMILAALVACLALTIAVRRHVQHVSLIANTSFVAMLAAFMLMI